MSVPKTKPPISRPVRPHRSPITFLINSAIKMGLGAGTGKIVTEAYKYMKDRNFEPFRPGSHDRDKDYYDEPITKYDHRKTDAPMTTQTGITKYDMTRRGPEGEVLHRPPMTGDRTATSYDMRGDMRTKGYYRDEITGEIIAYSGPQARGNPEVLNVAPKEEISRDSGEGVINDPDDYQFYENPEAIDHDVNTTRNVSDELQRHDVNFIEEYETKDFEDKPTTIPW